MELIFREDAVQVIDRILCRMNGLPEGAMEEAAREWLKNVPVIGDSDIPPKGKADSGKDADISVKVNVDGTDDVGRKTEQFLIELKKARSILKELAEILETLQVNIERGAKNESRI